MVKLPPNVLITFEAKEYMHEHSVLCGPCDIYAALGKIFNDKSLDTKNWIIKIAPSEITYFMGE